MVMETNGEERWMETERGTLGVAVVTAGDISPVSLRNQFTINQHREVLNPAGIRDESFDGGHKNE